MAGTSLFALLDDITALLDHVATLTKVATKKTAGVLGDDLALNAEQVTGVEPNRELSVVWAVAKGSSLNKVILVPAALAVSAFAPFLITPLLMIGGAFLCFEGFEKVAHKLLHGKNAKAADQAAHVRAALDPATDLVAFEKEKIRGAIRTDFILSAEIIVISLGTLAGQPFSLQIATLVAVSILMTVGVYGLVAGIVKLDDAGLALEKSGSSGARALGRSLLFGAPYLMKFLSLAGTAAMFLVGGGIVAHGIPPLHAIANELDASSFGFVTGSLFAAVVGLVTGGIAVLGLKIALLFRPKRSA